MNRLSDIRVLFLSRAAPGVILWGAALLAVLFVLPAVTDRYLMHVLTMSAIYVVMTLGLLVVLGWTGEFMVGYAGLVGIGAYMNAVLTAKLGFSFWLMLPAALGAAVAGGVLVGLLSVRFSGHFVAIVTFAFNILVYNVFLNWTSVTNGTAGIPSIPAITPVLGIEFDSRYAMFVTCWTVAIGGAALLHIVRHRRLGREFAAVRDDPLAAAASGIDVRRTRLIAYAICGLIGGCAGVLYASFVGVVEPGQYEFTLSVNVLAMLLIGGKASPVGALIGAVLLSVLPEYLRIVGDYRWLFYSSILILAMIVLPGGIIQLGDKVRIALSRVQMPSRRKVADAA